MDSMMNASVSMEMPMYGRSSHNCSITSHSQLWSKRPSSVSMEVSPHPSTPLIKLKLSTVYKKPHTRDQSVIFYGLTQMTDVVGESPQEEQVTPSVKTSPNNSTILMASPESPVPISWSWLVTTGPMTEMWSLSSPPLTTATDVETMPPSLN